MLGEVKKQLQRIETQIESEKRIHEAWSNYKDCPMKTAVIHQSIGVIRGLEVAKEALEYIINQQANNQMDFDEFNPVQLMMEETRKKGESA